MTPRLAFVALLVATVLAYAPLRTAEWVYEDANAVWQNATVTGAQPIPLDRARWLSALSHRVVFATLGPTPQATHAVNLALHLANGVLVYVLAAALVSPWAAVLGAGVFLLHPLQTEAVAYAASRSELLSTLFALWAVWIAIDARRWWEYLALGGCVIMALSAKESTIVVVPVIGWLFLARGQRAPRWLVGLVAVPLVAMTASVLWFDFHTRSELSALGFAATQATALWRYLALVVVPMGQTVDHDYDLVPWAVRALAIVALVAWGLLAILASLTVGNGDTSRTGRLWDVSAPTRALAWGTMWIAVTLAPRFLMRIPEALNEHQMYLPMVGISIALGVMLAGAPAGGQTWNCRD